MRQGFNATSNINITIKILMFVHEKKHNVYMHEKQHNVMKFVYYDDNIQPLFAA